jgi:hypothetical protein
MRCAISRTSPAWSSSTCRLRRAPPTPVGPPAWDALDNSEHFNYLAGFDAHTNKAGVPIKAPLTVVTASQGQSDQKDQSRWLKFSPDADAVLLEGGHVIYQDNPDGVANVIKAMLKRSKH